MSKLLLLHKLLKNYLYNIFSYIRPKKELHHEAPMVLFNLHSRRTEPYYYALIFSFHEAGYVVILKHNFMFIGNCFKAGRQIFKLPRLKISCNLSKNIRQECILVSDHLDKHLEKQWKKVVNIDFDVYSQKDTNSAWLTMPFHMSPEQYSSSRFRKTDSLRDSERIMRIFFSGNQDREAYNHPVIKDFFHKLSRIQIVDTLIDTLTNDELVLIEHSDQWGSIEGSYCNKFVLNRWTWSPEKSSNLKSRVADEDWLATLSRSDFFLATPGIRMPLCFNVIESMSVSTIPILQYPEYFDPPLEHLKNCIVFSNSEDLLRKIRNILSMSEKEISILKMNVISYYDEFLRIDRLPHMINRLEQYRVNLYINAEEASYQDHLKNNEAYLT